MTALDERSVSDVQVAADELTAAYVEGPIAPPTRRFPGFTLDDAYAVQQSQTARRISRGARVIGYKVGLTSAVMQAQLGIDQPDFGVLFDDMQHAPDAGVRVSNFLQPRAEPEIALVLGRPLQGPGVTVADVIRSTDLVLPAIEIIDSRIARWEISLVDTVADNASSGGVVLGSGGVRPEGIDLGLVGCVFRRDGRIVGSGAGAAVLGSPWNAAVWLVNTLGARGTSLQAGQVLLTGSMTAAVTVAAGQTVTATIDRVGSVTAVFD